MLQESSSTAAAPQQHQARLRYVHPARRLKAVICCYVWLLVQQLSQLIVFYAFLCYAATDLEALIQGQPARTASEPYLSHSVVQIPHMTRTHAHASPAAAAYSRAQWQVCSR